MLKKCEKLVSCLKEKYCQFTKTQKEK